jgi:Tfp pilus assembly protein PilF
MKSRLVLSFLIIFFACGVIFSEDNPWGNLKKIYFFDSVGNNKKVLETLENIDFEGILSEEQEEIAQDLIKFGDYYLSKADYTNAEAFYKKVLSLSPKYWYLYNKLEKMRRRRGGLIFGFKNVFKQFLLMIKNFNSSFLFLNSLLNMIFFTVIFVFFLFSIILFFKYFKLAGNDLLIDKNGNISIKKLIITILMLLWPLVVVSGWMIYPFLFTGFLWGYLNQNEKKSISYLLFIVVIVSMLYSLNIMLESNASDKKFKTIQQVYRGHLFTNKEYDTFDNDLKVPQAMSYYQNQDFDTALSILKSTGEDYKDKLKYLLMGNIYYLSEDLAESTKYYNEALRLDDKNKILLNNFTLALLKQDKNREDGFKESAKRYPEIKEYRKKVYELKELKVSSSANLWMRLFNFSSNRFQVGLFAKTFIMEFLKLPTVYFLVIFLLYLFLIKKIFPVIGDSTYCSKCSKIIKEASVHKSYKLCDECYQLFLIKDIIFLEAKILKEKELRKKFRKRYAVGLIVSILIPGLSLNFIDRNRLYIFSSMAFYFLLGFAIVGSVVFINIFSYSPIILNLIGMFAFVIYFFINLMALTGDKNGF